VDSLKFDLLTSDFPVNNGHCPNWWDLTDSNFDSVSSFDGMVNLTFGHSELPEDFKEQIRNLLRDRLGNYIKFLQNVKGATLDLLLHDVKEYLDDINASCYAGLVLSNVSLLPEERVNLQGFAKRNSTLRDEILSKISTNKDFSDLKNNSCQFKRLDSFIKDSMEELARRYFLSNFSNATCQFLRHLTQFFADWVETPENKPELTEAFNHSLSAVFETGLRLKCLLSFIERSRKEDADNVSECLQDLKDHEKNPPNGRSVVAALKRAIQADGGQSSRDFSVRCARIAGLLLEGSYSQISYEGDSTVYTKHYFPNSPVTLTDDQKQKLCDCTTAALVAQGGSNVNAFCTTQVSKKRAELVITSVEVQMGFGSAIHASLALMGTLLLLLLF